MNTPDPDLQAALDALTDDGPFDWDAAAAGTADPSSRETLGKLHLLATLAHACRTPDDGPRRRPPDPPFTWGPLEVVDRIGRGASGEVFRARDPRLERFVALKLLPLGMAPAHATADGMVREARMLARVYHPHVVSVHGAEEADGHVGIWMELVEGRTLHQIVGDDGPLAVVEVLAIARDLCGALAAVHDAGLVHGDVKAQNIVRTPTGRVVLMDFGAGRDMDGGASMMLTGTPLYMAPEVLGGGAPVSVRSDVYALGVLVHYLLTGSYPVMADSLGELTRARASGRVAQHGRGLPHAFARVVDRALEIEPDRRFQDTRQMATALSTMAPARRLHTPRFTALAVICAATLSSLAYLAVAHQDDAASPALIAEASPTLPVTSTSSEAVHLYLRAASDVFTVHDWREADARDRLRRADAWLVKASTMDPAFATAIALRARVRELQDDSPIAAVTLAEQALAHVGRLPPEERAAIEGYAARLRADVAPDRRDHLVAAANAYEDVLSRAPGDYWALRELSRIYGRLQQRADAERVITQGAVYHPHALHLAANAARVHLRRRDHETLRRVAAEALAHVRPEEHRFASEAGMDEAALAIVEVQDAWMDGDSERTLAAARRASRIYAHSANAAIFFALASAFESLGRFDDARASAQRISNEGNRAFKLALIDTRQERWDALRLRLTPGMSQPDTLRRYMFMYIFAGWLDDAERLLMLFKSGQMPSTWLLRQEFEGQLRAAQGRPAEALALFAPLLVDETDPKVRMREAVAKARLQAGDVHGARTLLERIYREPIMAVGRGLGGYDWLRCVVLLAEVYRDTGLHDEAAQVAGAARRYLTVADPDNPFSARLARLP